MPMTDAIRGNPYAPHPPAAQIVHGDEVGVLHNGPQDISNAILNALVRRRDHLVERLIEEIEFRDIVARD